MNKKVSIGIIVLIVLAAIGFASYQFLTAPTDKITATGTIEITRVDITPKVTGYLAELTIKQGDQVQIEQVVAKIGRPDLEAQMLRDQAALQKTEVQLKEMESGARSQELAEASANVTMAQTVHNKAKLDYDRYQNLAANGAISQQQLDAAMVSYDTAYSNLQTAQARLSLTMEGVRAETIEAQRLEIDRNKAVVAMVRSQLADTVISTPLAGVVLTKNYEKGEFVNAGAAIATIGDLNDCWVKIYLPSAQLGLITIGQQAAIKIDAYPDREFAGSIKEISQDAEFTPRQSLTAKERTNMVYAVKVLIDNSQGILKPGMPADVVIK